MAEASGGSKKLLWIMIVLVILSALGAAAAVYMVLGHSSDDAEVAQVQQVSHEPVTPVFTRIEPFTVNLADDRYGSRLLYTGITLRVGNEQSKSLIEEHMPQVRSRLLILLSGKQASELTSTEGKEALSQAIINRLTVPLMENQPPLDLQEVLFTDFIVQ